MRSRSCVCAAGVRERPAQAHQDAAEHTRRTVAGDRVRGPRSPPAVSELTALPERARSAHRLPQLRPPSLADSLGRGGYRGALPSLGPPPHLRHVRSARRRLSVFAVSRFMGSSIAMIDRHYGHLARDSREHAVSLLDALAVERAVDAGWTSHQSHAKQVSNSDSTPRRKPSRRAVDVRWTRGRPTVVAFAKKRS
jgi:hypothetical protein